MYQVAVSYHFDAAHFIRNYHGKCENLHGHRFYVAVAVEAEELDEAQLAYDFALLKRHLREVVDTLDHKSLNEVEPFDRIEPSSENISRTIYERIKEKIVAPGVRLKYVRVWETPESWATYGEGTINDEADWVQVTKTR